MGSFVCCQAWRVRYKDLGKKKLGKWSVCLKCGHKLSWCENIPILSWIFLGGRCKKCHAKIGIAEILSEVLMGIAFVIIGLAINIYDMGPVEWISFGVTLAFVVSLGFLAIYDGKWGELPNFALIIANCLSIAVCCTKAFGDWSELLNLFGAVLILFGTYFALNKASKGKWVGNGDAYVGLAIAFALGNAWLAIWVLFVANVLGCVVALCQKKKKIYFGPFLVIAYIIVFFCSDWMLNLL